jgi:hypothetical protein
MIDNEHTEYAENGDHNCRYQRYAAASLRRIFFRMIPRHVDRLVWFPLLESSLDAGEGSVLRALSHGPAAGTNLSVTHFQSGPLLIADDQRRRPC